MTRDPVTGEPKYDSCWDEAYHKQLDIIAALKKEIELLKSERDSLLNQLSECDSMAQQLEEVINAQ